MSIFTSKNVWKLLKKKSADKIKGIKMSFPMPDRVKEKEMMFDQNQDLKRLSVLKAVKLKRKLAALCQSEVTKRLPLANQIQNLILGYVFDIPNIVSSPLLYNCGLL